VREILRGRREVEEERIGRIVKVIRRSVGVVSITLGGTSDGALVDVT
jgi:hypothetical protein